MRLFNQSNIYKIFTRSASTDLFDYNYLEKSQLPTNVFEKSLPRLPLPSLSDTCSNYLLALRPLIADDKIYSASRRTVHYFEGGAGHELHEELTQLDKQNQNTSYISEPWFDMYLSSRTPLPINYNPFLAWKDDPSKENNEPRIRASNYIISALRFRRSLFENVLAPEIFHLNPKKSNTDLYRKVISLTPARIAWYVSAAFKAFPLDMSQYGSLFHSTRIPRASKDTLEKFPHTKHIVIMCRGHFYTFDVLRENGDIKTPQEIYSAVKHIYDSTTTDDENSISILTTLNRDEWAHHREKLISDSENMKNLQQIDSAIFVVCLDNDIDFLSLKNMDHRILHSHNFLHGCLNLGSQKRPLNRWFDKSFSMIFTKDGQSAINFEHSWGDGVAVLRFFNEIYKDSASKKFVDENTKPDSGVEEEITRLSFNLDDDMKSTIKAASDSYRKWTKGLDLNYILYNRMNRDYFKKSKLSPDSMFQLAFQLAYHKISDGQTPVTYESSSTAAFKHGRTETVRPATMETKKACYMINSPPGQFSHADILRAIRDCSTKHSKLTKDAAMGKGFDRHLFALKYLAAKKGMKTPSVFTDPNYTYANHFTLSTSTLYGECFSGGGFGPVVSDGFGLGYGYFDQSLGVFCSSYGEHRNGKEFLHALKESLDKLCNILDSKEESE